MLFINEYKDISKKHEKSSGDLDQLKEHKKKTEKRNVTWRDNRFSSEQTTEL